MQAIGTKQKPLPIVAPPQAKSGKKGGINSLMANIGAGGAEEGGILDHPND